MGCLVEERRIGELQIYRREEGEMPLGRRKLWGQDRGETHLIQDTVRRKPSGQRGGGAMSEEVRDDPSGKYWREGPGIRTSRTTDVVEGPGIRKFLVRLGGEGGRGTATVTGATRRKMRRRTKQRKKGLTQLRIDIKRKIEESEAYGSDLISKEEKGMTIYFQNVNGIWKEKGEDMKDSLQILETAGASYIGITESLVNARSQRAQQVK